jgi:U3 small nucleolar ribonucleoprotein protein IMP3
MGRKLKHHEQLLLKKHNFFYSRHDTNRGELTAMRRYHLEDRGDYLKYNRLVGRIHSLGHRIKRLSPSDPFRISITSKLLDKLYSKGLVRKTDSLALIEEITTSTLCRRRLPVVMVRLKMAETVKAATNFVHHGHVRVGPEIVTDPAFMVSRAMEDYITWADGSKIKRAVATYNDQVDDYDLLGE